MCTSIVYENNNQDFFLARTMDFSIPLDGKPIFIPKNYSFYEKQKEKNFTTQYDFIGAGKMVEEYMFADGVNEKGLSAASLYFSDDAVYSKSEHKNEVTLASHDVIAWLLGNCESVKEVKDKLTQMLIIEEVSAIVGGVVPLHWVVADKTGESVVIESVATGLHIYDNSVRVMTNSPSYPWHLTNLNQYAKLADTSSDKQSFKDFVAQGNGAGSGALGLPGDYTSISRFIRMAFVTEFAEKGNSSLESVNIISRMLAAVYIPKGIKRKKNGVIDYTQYMSFMDLSAKKYYINYYESNRFIEIELEKISKMYGEPKIFNMSHELKIENVTD